MKTNYFIAAGLIAISSLTAFSFFSNNEKMGELTTSTCKKTTVKQKTTQKFSFDKYVDSKMKEFHYELGNRFINHVSKTDLDKAKTIWDILPANVKRQVRKYSHTQIHILKPNGDIIAKGSSESLNEKQLELIKEMNYSTNLRVFADYSPIETPQSNDYISYYMTVVPFLQAHYPGGKENLLNQIKFESSEVVNKVDPTSLEPGKIFFIVSREGTIDSFGLESSCGNKEVDMKMLSIINNLPKKWTPAKNEQGDRIEQTLYFSFGLMGC